MYALRTYVSYMEAGRRRRNIAVRVTFKWDLQLQKYKVLYR